MVCQGHVLCDAAGMPSSFFDLQSTLPRACNVLFYAWLLLYPPVVGFLSRRLPASHFVRSLTWSISDVKHVGGCGGQDSLRPMPDMQTIKGREVRRPIFLPRVGSYGTCRFLDTVTYQQPELAVQIIAK